MFSLKPDFEKVLARYNAWWNCEIVDRPLVSIVFRKPVNERPVFKGKTHATVRDRWLDVEYTVARAEASLNSCVHYADSLPVAWPNLGPEVFSAYYGCEMDYGEHTAWSVPILQDWSDESVAKLRFDAGNFYYRKTLEMTDALIAAGKGRFVVGYTDMHGGGDAIAAFRNPQELLIDTIERQADIKRLCDRITGDFLRVYDSFYERLTAAGMPSTTWCPVTGSGRVHIPSNDFSCMISDETFEDLFIPGIIRECRHMDHCLYHLDGRQALRFLDRLLDIPEIHAIQWVPGAGHEYWAGWIEVYQRIQNRKKALQLSSIPARDLPHLFEVLAPRGVWISSVSGIQNEAEASAVLNLISGWTRKT